MSFGNPSRAVWSREGSSTRKEPSMFSSKLSVAEREVVERFIRNLLLLSRQDLATLFDGGEPKSSPPRTARVEVEQPFGPVEATPQVLISTPVYDEVLSTLGKLAPEAGGLLLGPKNHRAITHFMPDPDAERTASTFE